MAGTTINSINNSFPAQQSGVKRLDDQTGGSGFGELLKDSIQAVNDRRQEADNMVKGLVAGEHANIHETMIALEKASVSLRMMTRVQQKIIAAYQEISRMQV